MTQTRSTRFLIVGAGGRNGATGNHATRQLLAMGLPVRAFVRQADDRADELRALGAEIAVGDIHNFEAVRAALDGVQRAYFTYPIADGLLEATATFAAAGKQAGLQSMVNMSQITARPDHPSPAARQHWLAERLLDWSGIAVTHLRPPFFLENLIAIAATTIQTEGKIYLPYGQGHHAPVAGEDLARVAVGILTIRTRTGSRRAYPPARYRCQWRQWRTFSPACWTALWNTWTSRLSAGGRSFPTWKQCLLTSSSTYCTWQRRINRVNLT